MPLNSHVQLSTFLIVNFSKKHLINNNGYRNKNDMSWILDLKTKIITLDKPKKIGTVYRYYDDKTENMLSSEETKFGEFINKIREWKKVGGDFHLSEYEMLLKTFSMLQFLRSSNLQKKLIERNITQNLKPSDIINAYINNPELFPVEEYMADYRINLLVNQSQSNFVLPKCCWFSVLEEDSKHWQMIMPIDPKIAVILYHKDYESRYLLREGKIGLSSIVTDEQVFGLNKYALNSEQNADNDFIVSISEKELRDLIPVLSTKPIAL